jgi:hypothetical protein
MDVRKFTNQQNKGSQETEKKINYLNYLGGGSTSAKYNNNNYNNGSESNYVIQAGNNITAGKSNLRNFLNENPSHYNVSNHNYSLSQSQTIKKSSNFMKETSSPNLEKAKKVIEDKRLYKLKHYLVKTGAMKI